MTDDTRVIGTVGEPEAEPTPQADLFDTAPAMCCDRALQWWSVAYKTDPGIPVFHAASCEECGRTWTRQPGGAV